MLVARRGLYRCDYLAPNAQIRKGHKGTAFDTVVTDSLEEPNHAFLKDIVVLGPLYIESLSTSSDEPFVSVQ